MKNRELLTELCRNSRHTATSSTLRPVSICACSRRLSSLGWSRSDTSVRSIETGPRTIENNERAKRRRGRRHVGRSGSRVFSDELRCSDTMPLCSFLSHVKTCERPIHSPIPLETRERERRTFTGKPNIADSRCLDAGVCFKKRALRTAGQRQILSPTFLVGARRARHESMESRVT